MKKRRAARLRPTSPSPAPRSSAAHGAPQPKPMRKPLQQPLRGAHRALAAALVGAQRARDVRRAARQLLRQHGGVQQPEVLPQARERMHGVRRVAEQRRRARAPARREAAPERQQPPLAMQPHAAQAVAERRGQFRRERVVIEFHQFAGARARPHQRIMPVEQRQQRRRPVRREALPSGRLEPGFGLDLGDHGLLRVGPELPVEAREFARPRAGAVGADDQPRGQPRAGGERELRARLVRVQRRKFVRAAQFRARLRQRPAQRAHQFVVLDDMAEFGPAGVFRRERDAAAVALPRLHAGPGRQPRRVQAPPGAAAFEDGPGGAGQCEHPRRGFRPRRARRQRAGVDHRRRPAVPNQQRRRGQPGRAAADHRRLSHARPRAPARAAADPRPCRSAPAGCAAPAGIRARTARPRAARAAAGCGRGTPGPAGR